MNRIQPTWRQSPASVLAESDDLCAHWDRLNDARGGVPVLASAVVCTALEILGDGSERLLIARQDDSIVAMLVVASKGSWRWGTFQPSQLPLGTWVAAPPLTPTDLARSLLRGPLAPGLLMSFTQIEPRIAERPQDVADSLTLDYVDTGWIDIEGDFEDYWQARGKNLRANHRKQRNRLAANGVNVQMRVVREPGEVGAAVGRYAEIETRSWKARGGTAVQTGNDQDRFYRTLLERLAVHGSAAVYEYWFGGDLVASDLAIERGGLTVVLKTTYNEDFAAYSPAFLLREAELQHLFEEKRIRRLEFYGRLMEWHQRWTSQWVRLYHLTVYRWPLLKSVSRRLGDRKRSNASQLDAAGTQAN